MKKLIKIAGPADDYMAIVNKRQQANKAFLSKKAETIQIPERFLDLSNVLAGSPVYMAPDEAVIDKLSLGKGLAIKNADQFYPGQSWINRPSFYKKLLTAVQGYLNSLVSNKIEDAENAKAKESYLQWTDAINAEISDITIYERSAPKDKVNKEAFIKAASSPVEDQNGIKMLNFNKLLQWERSKGSGRGSRGNGRDQGAPYGQRQPGHGGDYDEGMSVSNRGENTGGPGPIDNQYMRLGVYPYESVYPFVATIDKLRLMRRQPIINARKFFPDDSSFQGLKKYRNLINKAQRAMIQEYRILGEQHGSQPPEIEKNLDGWNKAFEMERVNIEEALKKIPVGR